MLSGLPLVFRTTLDSRLPDGPRSIPPGQDESEWRAALKALGIPEDAVLHAQSQLDAGRRVYVRAAICYKVVLHSLESTSQLRARSLAEEGAVLQHLSGTTGVPAFEFYRRGNGAEVLALQWADGVTWADSRGGWVRGVWRFGQLLRLLARLSSRGVVHGDLTIDNVLIDRRQNVWLIDYDQSFVTSKARAALGNFLGISFDGATQKMSLTALSKQVIKRSLPGWAVSGIRRAKRAIVGVRRPDVGVLQPLPSEASEKLQLLHTAWRRGAASDANSPGEGVCYYTLEVDGFAFPGERSWADRWQIIRGAVSFEAERVLELGCNMGLLSTYALLEGAEAAMGVDADGEILHANALVQRAFGVSYATRQQNFDSPDPWEEALSAFRPTIVTALSVLNWVQDKPRFMRFLGRFGTVLLEGHDPVEVEAERLGAAGFTDVRVVAISERGRPVLVARKQPANVAEQATR